MAKKYADKKNVLKNVPKKKLKLAPKKGLKKFMPQEKIQRGPVKIDGKTVLKEIDRYQFNSNEIPIDVRIIKVKEDYVPIYNITISAISKETEFILEKVRGELIKEVDLGAVEVPLENDVTIIEKKFEESIKVLIEKYFPGMEENVSKFLIAYLINRSLGMGNIEILMDDNNLEEVAINGAKDPVWVYHRKHGWLKTNLMVKSEEEVKHYSSMIGRKIGRQINVLSPLMDANLQTGDRVNATLAPISNFGNTITLRKFAAKPWTITDFIKNKTTSFDTAAMIWLGVQYELSILISGGTATGKTSMLNVVANFFPQNQRIISIEDTREIRLPKYLHWVPMLTRLPNPEGKGEVSMLDLLVNSLRMRPDRIVVGEIRRKREAEVLFEAIHTGHSVYATVHANNTQETITRLTNPPIEVPKTMLPAISMIVVQYRNRRTGIRRTFQVSEINPDSSTTVILQYDPKKDDLKSVAKSKTMMKTIGEYTGLSLNTLQKDLKEKVNVLKWLVKQDIDSVDGVGKVMAEYYSNKENLMKYVHANKKLE